MINIEVCTPPDHWAAFPQVIRTEREIVLCYAMQEIKKLRSSGIHQHFQPFPCMMWSVSTDDGYSWRTTDRAPSVGRILDCSYGQPTADGGMVTISCPKPFISKYAFLQKGNVGYIPYSSHLPAEETVHITDLGPSESFYFHSMTRTSDGGLLAAGYAPVDDEDEAGCCAAVFLKSEDEGMSWRYLSQVSSGNDSFGFTETGLLGGEDGHVLCLLRTDFHGSLALEQKPPEARKGAGYFLYQVESWDNGETWSDPVQLPIWGHPPHLTRLQSGAILLVNGHRRPPYSVRAVLSYDNGKSWDMKTMRSFRTFDPGHYDIGYPQATQLDDGTILCTYYGYSTPEVDTSSPYSLSPCGIFVSLFDEEWLEKGEG